MNIPQARTVIALVLAAWGAVGCGPAQPSETTKPGVTNAAATPGSGNPLTAPVDYLGAVGAAQKRAAKVVDLTSLQQAVAAFQAGEERLPSSLQELVKEGYLPRLPAAPAGQAFRYDPQTGRVGMGPVAQ